MDILFIIAGVILILMGLAGSILPVLPGPPLAYLGIIALHLTSFVHYGTNFLVITGILAIIITLLDYVVPSWGTKRFGGSQMGVRGAMIGTIAGIFVFPPFGIILGPFLGAFIAEMIHENNTQKALRSGLGSFMGFLVGSGMKLIYAAVLTFYFVKEIIVAM